MKVLWFSNTPANASEYLNQSTHGGGWLKTLDIEIQDKIELHVAFYHNSIEKKFKYLNTTYHVLNGKSNKIKILKNLLFKRQKYEADLPEYLEVIERVKPDIIHIHGTEDFFLSIVNQTNIPIVVSIQGILNGIFRKYLNYFTLSDLKYKNYKLEFNLKKILFNKNFYSNYKDLEQKKNKEKEYLKYVKFIIGRTDWDYYYTKSLAPSAKYFKVDEVMREPFYQLDKINTKGNYESNKIILHSTLSDSPYKGIEVILEASKILNELHFDFEWRIAGITENDTTIKILKKKENNISKNIIFLGKLIDIELKAKLEECNIFVMASHIDNSSNSLCEAMLQAKPCIGTFAGGTSTIIENNVDGILIQSGDPYTLAGSIISLSRDNDLQKKISKNARIKSLNKHNKNQIINQLINAYKEILNDSRN